MILNNSYYYNRSWFNPETPQPEEVELSHTTESALDTVVQMSKVDTLALSLDHESAAVWEFEGYIRRLGIQPLAQDLRLRSETPILGNPKHDREVLPKLLKMFAQNVRCLELDFRRWHCTGKLNSLNRSGFSFIRSLSPAGDTSVIFPLLEFHNLRHLSVHICPVGPEGQNVKWFPDFLSSINSGSPYQLTLGIYIRDMKELKCIGLSRTDQILSTKANTELEQVVLAVSVVHRRLVCWEEIYHYMTGELPEVIALGIVEFVYV